MMRYPFLQGMGDSGKFPLSNQSWESLARQLACTLEFAACAILPFDVTIICWLRNYIELDARPKQQPISQPYWRLP